MILPRGRRSFVVRTLLGCAALLTTLTACGGPSREDVTKKHGRIIVEGTVSLRGSPPFQLLFIEVPDGEAYMVQPSPITDELERLDGISVAVTGELLPVVLGEPPVIAPISYELLPLPGGRRPIMGEISVEGRECTLHTADGKRYVVSGEFVSVLSELAGAKVWVVGEVSRVKGTKWSIIVTGYQLLRPPQ